MISCVSFLFFVVTSPLVLLMIPGLAGSVGDAPGGVFISRGWDSFFLFGLAMVGPGLCGMIFGSGLETVFVSLCLGARAGEWRAEGKGNIS